MASRVNIRFAIILSASLAGIFAVVAGAAAFIHLTSGARHVRAGDAAMEAGDFAAAENSYSRAVAKDQSNAEWLLKWRDAMERKIPQTETEYRDDFRMYAGGILPTIANLLRTDVDATATLFDLRVRQLRYAPFSREVWETLMRDAEAHLGYYEADKPGDPSWQRLRRYRGIPIVEIMKNTTVVETSLVEKAKADLVAATTADPHDEAASGALMEWHLVRAQQAERSATPAAAEPFRAEAAAIVDRFLEANPGNAWGLARRLALRIEVTQRSIDPRLTDIEKMNRLRAMANSLEGDLLGLGEAIKQMPASDAALVARFGSLCQIVAPDRAYELMLDAADAQLARHPDDADLLIVRADIMENRRDYAGAIETHQRILNLPDRPVSLEGVTRFDRRTHALFMQASLALQMSERTTDRAERAAAVAKAREYRDALAKRLSARDALLLLLGAKVRFAEADLLGAQKLLTEFNAVSASTTPSLQVEGLMLAGRVAALLDQFGLAEERFSAVLQRRPNDLMAMASLAEVSVKLNKMDRALLLMGTVAKADPENKALQARYLELQTIMGLVQSDDPVRQLIINARKRMMGDAMTLADPIGAIGMLREGLALHANDPRLIEALATALFSQERIDEAIVEAEKGLAAYPGNERFAEMLKYLRSSTSLEAALALIDAAEATEVEKLVERYRQYRKFEAEPSLALDALRRAYDLDPSNPTTTELMFVEALRARDMPAAERLADDAARRDLDRVGGVVFRARVLSAQGKNAEAATLLQQAVDGGVANSRLLRLLATIQVDLGRTPAAIQSFREALKRQPDDTETAMIFIDMLSKLELFDDALNVARSTQEFGRGNRRFVNQWLDLEARAGNRDYAISIREQMHRLNPDDPDNVLALATLYTDARRWDDARALIDRVRSSKDSIHAAYLDARWHADQNNLEAARNIFVSYIVRMRAEVGDEAMTPEPYMTFGQFMIERRDPDVGLAAIDQGRRFQSPTTRAADLFKGDMLFRLARFDDARAVYHELIEARLPADADLSITKRYIEATIRAGKPEEADTVIRAMGEKAMSDLGLILLAAEAANTMNDSRRSLSLLERAVTNFPNDPVAFFRRARTISADPERRADAIADLNTALRIRPNFWQAIRARADIHRENGNVDLWLGDLRATLEANPLLDDLRQDLILELIRRGREGEAVDVAKSAVAKRPSDLLLRAGIGESFMAGNLPARAVEFLEPVWIDVKDPGIAQRLVSAYLRQQPPALAKADALLSDRRLSVEAFPGLLMGRARLRALQNRPDDVRSDAARAFDLVVAEPTSIMEWFKQLREIYHVPKDANAFLSNVDLSRGPETWTTFFRAEILASDPATREQAVDLLRTAEAGARSPVLRVAIHRLQSVILYELGRFEDAATAMRRGLEVDPGSAELNNNLAYVLAKELKRPSEALPFARRATDLNPNSPGILDTLGYVLRESGDLDAAEETLTRALRMSSLAADKALVSIHLGELMVLRGDPRRALEFAQQARQHLRSSPDLEARFSKELDELTARIR